MATTNQTAQCSACHGTGKRVVQGAKNLKYIAGIGYRSVPIKSKCPKCNGTGRPQ